MCFVEQRSMFSVDEEGVAKRTRTALAHICPKLPQIFLSGLMVINGKLSSNTVLAHFPSKLYIGVKADPKARALREGALNSRDVALLFSVRIGKGTLLEKVPYWKMYLIGKDILLELFNIVAFTWT